MSKYQARPRQIRISPTIDRQSSYGSAGDAVAAPAGSDTELKG